MGRMMDKIRIKTNREGAEHDRTSHSDHLSKYTLEFTVRSRTEVVEYRSRESKDRVSGEVPGGNSTTT
jgi:hypothetical protein